MFRCDRVDRWTEIHLCEMELRTRDMRTLPVWYSSNLFSSKPSPLWCPRHRCFRKRPVYHEEPGSPTMSFIMARTHVATPCTWLAFIRPPFCPTQTNSPKSTGRVNDRKDGANNRRMCVRGRKKEMRLAILSRPEYTTRIARTSRDRDDVSNLLVLIKKSHKVPPGRDIAASARYIITMIYRMLRAAVRRTFAEAVKEDWKHLQA